jgi:hypothetical protein
MRLLGTRRARVAPRLYAVSSAERLQQRRQLGDVGGDTPGFKIYPKE